MTTTARAFMWVSRLEGLSLLILMGIAMPLKYGLGYTEATQLPGWAHGVLFLAYVVALLAAARPQRWSMATIALGLVASLVPFGTFVFEARHLRREPNDG